MGPGRLHLESNRAIIHREPKCEHQNYKKRYQAPGEKKNSQAPARRAKVRRDRYTIVAINGCSYRNGGIY